MIMVKRLCDVCKTNTASKSFKVKEAHKNLSPLYKGMWTSYKKIDICDECAEKLLNIESEQTKWYKSIEMMTGHKFEPKENK